MDGVRSSTELEIARALRAVRRSSEHRTMGTQESQSANSVEVEQPVDRSSDEDGLPPVYHHEIWNELVEMGSMNGLLHYVNEQPEHGSDPRDITAVESTQIAWAFREDARKFRPHYVTLWERPASWENPTYEIGILRSSEGRIVLDYRGRTIRDFRNLPLTISSKVEGLRMEEWLRADKRILFDDIVARMWTKRTLGGEKLPIFPKTALTKRMSIARIQSGLIGFHKRANRERQNAFMDNLRTPAQRAQNLATDHDLTDEQIADWMSIGHNQPKKSNASSHQASANRIKKVAVAPAPTPIAQVEDQDVEMTTDVETGGNLLLGPGWWEFPIASNTGNLSIAYQDPLDSRNERPKDHREQEMLQDALMDTIDDFLARTGRLPNPALYKPRSNYFSQWYLLQAEFEMVWAMNGSLDPPRLCLLGRWTGGIFRWHVQRTGEDEYLAIHG